MHKPIFSNKVTCLQEQALESTVLIQKTITYITCNKRIYLTSQSYSISTFRSVRLFSDLIHVIK